MSRKTDFEYEKKKIYHPNDSFSKKNALKVIFKNILINIAVTFKRVASKVFLFVKLTNNIPIPGSMR